MNAPAIRLLSQQLVNPQFDTPAEVVSHMGAIQAQEYRMVRWAVAMRTRKPSAEAFKRAFDSGQIIRLHLMRGTWQLVAADDYRTLLELCAPKALAVTRGWMHSSGISIGEKEEAEVRGILVRAAEEKGSVTKEDFSQALAAKGICMDEHRLSFHIRVAEMSGILCSGNLMPMKATYALAEEKVKPRSRMNRDEALAMLAHKYFRSRQPATLEDFVWWSGLSVSDCRRGIALLGDTIRGERWKGRTFYLTEDCRTRGFRRGRYLLIPPYDEYLISYKSRDIVLPAAFIHRAHDNRGIFMPIITYDGIVCGNWSPFKDDCNAQFFTPEHESGLPQEWSRYKAMQKG